MNLLITDPGLSRRLIRQRRARGLDKRDEVWDGVYIMAPPPNDEHQDIAGSLFFALQISVRFANLGLVRSGVAVSNLDIDWTKNFRVPDVSVFLYGSAATNKKSYWFGGPDFAIEIISPNDRSREKLDFYARNGVKELLLVDREPWALELYRLIDGVLVLVASSSLKQSQVLTSQVVPLSFQLLPGDPRPTIEMAHADGVQRWSA